MMQENLNGNDKIVSVTGQRSGRIKIVSSKGYVLFSLTIRLRVIELVNAQIERGDLGIWKYFSQQPCHPSKTASKFQDFSRWKFCAPDHIEEKSFLESVVWPVESFLVHVALASVQPILVYVETLRHTSVSESLDSLMVDLDQ